MIRFEPLPTIAGGIVLALWARALALQVPNYNYSDTFGPTLVALGELTLVPDSAVTWFYGGAQMVLPQLIAGACSLTGLSPEFMHTAIELVTVTLALLCLGIAATRIAGTRWAGALTIIAIPFAWPFALSVGYSAPFWSGYTTAGFWGFGWTCAVWGLWFASRSTGIGAFLPFALAGFEFLAHPTWAIVTLSVLGLGELLEIIAAPRRAVAIRVAVIRIGLALLIASPQILMIVGNLRQSVRPEDMAGWWPLIQFRKSFHFYIWDAIAFWRLAILAVLIALSTAWVWPLLDANRRRRAVATLLAVAALITVAYLTMEIVPNKSLSALVLSRSGSLLSAVAIVFVVASATASLIRREARGAVAVIVAWTALLAVTVPVDAALYATWSEAVSRQTPDAVRAIGNFSLSLLLTIVALGLALLLRSRAATPVHSPLLPVLCGALIVLLTIVKLPLIPPVQGSPTTATWNGLTDYVREQTPRESLMMMPPYPYSVASARRSYVQDYSLIGAAVYNPPMTSFELDVLRNVYEIDIEGLSHTEIRQLLNKNNGILCMLERSYRSLVGSEARMRAVKSAYPALSFVVGFKPGVTPLEWTCGAYDGPVLPMPIAYENAEYVLYDVRGLDTQEHR